MDSELEDEEELNSPIQLNKFKIVILGPGVPEYIQKNKSLENATFDFIAENGATYTVHNGLMFFKSLPKLRNTANLRSDEEQTLKLKLQRREREELFLVGALALCCFFGIIMTCSMFLLVRRMKKGSRRWTARNKNYQSSRSEYQPLGSKDDETLPIH